MLPSAHIDNFSSVTKHDRLNAMCDMRESREKKYYKFSFFIYIICINVHKYSYTIVGCTSRSAVFIIFSRQKTENLAEMCEYEKAVFSPETLLHYRGIAYSSENM